MFAQLRLFVLVSPASRSTCIFYFLSVFLVLSSFIYRHIRFVEASFHLRHPTIAAYISRDKFFYSISTSLSLFLSPSSQVFLLSSIYGIGKTGLTYEPRLARPNLTLELCVVPSNNFLHRLLL